MLIALVVAAAGALLALRQPTPEGAEVYAPALSVPDTSLAIEARSSEIVAPALRIVAQTIPTEDPNPPTDPLVLRADVLFEFGKARLTGMGRDGLSAVAEILRRRDVRRIRIDGHTDAIGSALDNLDLSRRRALTVARELRRLLDDAAPRMDRKAFGEASPVAPNIHPDGSDNPVGRCRNRRVVIRIVAAVRSGSVEPQGSRQDRKALLGPCRREHEEGPGTGG